MNIYRILSFLGRNRNVKEVEERTDSESSIDENFDRSTKLPFSSSTFERGDPPLDAGIENMLTALASYLPPLAPPLPDSSISAINVIERTVGLGNRRGIERRGSFAVVELKGLQLDALVQYQLWADSAAQAETEANDLNIRLMSDRDTLWNTGFLRLALESSSPAEHISSTNAWRKTADYRVLYEHRYLDTDGAESLIARIPVHSDLEIFDSINRETSTVTDEMVRWDDEAAPELIIRGPFNLGRLSTLTFIPGILPDGSVTLTRTFEGTSDPPTIHANLTDFLSAVTDHDTPDRNAQLAFASLNDFLSQFGAAGDPITIVVKNDAGEVIGENSYQSSVLVFENIIHLPDVADRLEITFGNPEFNQVGVVYLRANRT